MPSWVDILCRFSLDKGRHVTFGRILGRSLSLINHLVFCNSPSLLTISHRFHADEENINFDDLLSRTSADTLQLRVEDLVKQYFETAEKVWLAGNSEREGDNVCLSRGAPAARHDSAPPLKALCFESTALSSH